MLLVDLTASVLAKKLVELVLVATLVGLPLADLTAFLLAKKLVELVSAYMKVESALVHWLDVTPRDLVLKMA